MFRWKCGLRKRGKHEHAGCSMLLVESVVLSECFQMTDNEMFEAVPINIGAQKKVILCFYGLLDLLNITPKITVIFKP